MNDSSDDPDDDALTPRRPTAAEIARHRRTYPHGMPTVQAELGPEPDDDDNLGLLYAEQPSSRDHRALRRAGRDPGASVNWGEISAIVRRLEERAYDRLGGDVARLRDVVEGAPGRPGLTETVASHSHVIGPARSAASWALRGAVAALVAVGAFLYWRGRGEQHVIDEVQVLTDKVHRLERLTEANPKDSRQ